MDDVDMAPAEGLAEYQQQLFSNAAASASSGGGPGQQHGSGGPYSPFVLLRAPEKVTLNHLNQEDMDSFDLDQLIYGHEGRQRVDRLLFIGNSLPSHAAAAYSAALATLTSSDSLDIGTYTSLGRLMEQAAPGSFVPDQAWLHQAQRTVDERVRALEVELKGHMNNLNKESIRLGHRDLADFYHRAGMLQDAIRTHSKAKEFCTTSDHIIELSLKIIDLGFDLQDMGLVRFNVSKAETALDAHLRGLTGQTRAAGVAATAAMQSSAANAQREAELTKEKVGIAKAVAELKAAQYEKCARSIIALTSANEGKTTGWLPSSEIAGLPASASDLAVYLVLCSLATFTRGGVKVHLLDAPHVRSLLSLDSHLRPLISAFHSADYSRALSLLARNTHRYLLDPNLALHYRDLEKRIRTVMIERYFGPFGRVKIDRMAKAFGRGEEEMWEEAVEAVKKGLLKARIDAVNKSLVAYEPDKRAQVHARVLEMDRTTERAIKQALLRINLIQSDIIVKPQPGERGRGGGGGGGGDGDFGGEKHPRHTQAAAEGSGQAPPTPKKGKGKGKEKAIEQETQVVTEETAGEGELVPEMANAPPPPEAEAEAEIKAS